MTLDLSLGLGGDRCITLPFSIVSVVTQAAEMQVVRTVDEHQCPG